MTARISLIQEKTRGHIFMLYRKPGYCAKRIRIEPRSGGRA